MRFSDFDHDAAFARERAAAFDRVVGTFESFDRDDRSVFHDHGLSNVEAGNLLRDLPAKIDIFFLATTELWSGD